MDDTEIEEGEACYYKDDMNIDPDIALSYIDEKLHSVLGHFQKDFEGGVSAENLGAKFGGYGSFLPTYQRSPLIRSHPKTPLRAQNFSSPKSPNVLPIEGAPQNTTAPTESAQSLKRGTASRSLHSLHTPRGPLGDVSAKQGLCFSSAQETEKLLPKHESVSNKRDNPADQRTLKVRIKLGSDNIAKKNDAIYSGLGLMSPSSSMGNSLEESGGPFECQQSFDDSPNRIIQIMTSFPVPSGSLLSPLQESFLSLARKAKLLQNNKPVPAIKSAQEHFSTSAGERKVSKEKKTKIVEKSDNLVVLNQEARTDFDDNRTSLLKREVAIEARNSVNKTPVLKHSLSNDTKLKPSSGSVCNAVDSWKSVCMDPGVPKEAGRDIYVKKREVIKNGMEDTLSTGLVKEESLESISNLEGGKYEKPEARSSLTEKIFDSRLRNSHTVATDPMEDGQSKVNKVSTPFKADTDVFKCKRDPTIRAMDPSGQKVGQTATYQEQHELDMSHGVGRSSSEGKKKPKGSQSNGELASEAQESLIAEVYEAPKEKKKAGKMHKSKSRKDIRKAHDNYRDLLPETRVEEMNSQINSLERPLGDRAKDSKLEVVGKERYVFLDKSKKIGSYNKVSTQLTSETFLKEVVNDGRPPANGVTSEMEPPSVAPVVIEEDWVCCDRCQKWRLLPYGTKPEQLPEKWLCSMLNWLPGMSRCDISEEETTKALRALYQLPLPESQNNLQHHVDRNAAGAPSADACCFDRNHPNLHSHGMPNPRKKKQGSKEMPGNGGPIQTLGSTKSHRQDPLKSRSLNNVNQPILESNLMSNSDVRHSRKSCNFPVENNAHKQREKHPNNGDAKHKKPKSKREADHYGYGTTKKIKTDVPFDADKYLTTEHSGNTDKISHGLPTKAALKSMEKHSEHSYSKGAKSDKKEKVQISAKKEEEQASVPLHNGSLDVKTYDREISPKKRKLKDWQKSQNHVEILRNNGNSLPESKVYLKEESSDSEFRKTKKSRLSRAEGKESSTSRDGDRLNRKGMMTRIPFSGSRENPVQDKEEVRSIGKDHQPRKHKSKVASKPASDDMDSLKGDLGSDQFSRAATSSSSKVSDSRKSKAHLAEVKGSPVESVSSSPMRTSNLEKLSHSGKGMLGKDAARNGDFLVMDGPGKTLDGEGNIESSRSGTARMEKVSVVSHSESLGFPVLDFQDKNNDVSQKFGGKSKSSVRSFEFRNSRLVNSDAENLESPFPGNLNASNHCHNEDRLTKNHYSDNSLFWEKSGKVSSLLSKEKDRSSANFESIKVKVSNPPSEIDVLNPKRGLMNVVETKAHHVLSQNEESTHLKCRNKHIKDDKRGSGKWESDSKRDNQLEFMEHDGSAVNMGALCHKDSRVTRVPPQQDLIQDFEGEVTEKNDANEMESGDGNSQAFPHHAGKQGPSAHVPHSVSLSRKGNVLDAIPADSTGNGDLSKVLKRPTNAVNPLGYPVPDQRALKNAPSPLRRDSSGHVAINALKEAENLRDYADRLKDSGFGFECNEAYFQAALKFLHGASLLEACNGDSSKYGEMSQMQIYGSSAKLCEICALEYEKRQEMAAAALAYKCMEVACMKVVYCKNSSTNRDRHDLQGSLQMVPQGESPSSSASDVDNLNNQAVVDKAALSKGIGVHAGNHVILARNRPNFVRLLDFTKDVNSAMEASRKSQNAFAAATVILEEAQNKDGIISVKRVIDFSFQDVEELIRLVRLAIEATSRQGFSGIKD